jgi:hypothetical protein
MALHSVIVTLWHSMQSEASQRDASRAKAVDALTLKSLGVAVPENDAKVAYWVAQCLIGLLRCCAVAADRANSSADIGARGWSNRMKAFPFCLL